MEAELPISVPEVGKELFRHDENDHWALQKAKQWEAEQGYVEDLAEKDEAPEGETPIFHYEYRNIDDAPPHHYHIALLVLQKLDFSEICAARKESPAMIRRILEHWPVRQFVKGQLARQKVKVQEIQESKKEQRRKVADLGIAAIEDTLTGERKAETATIKAAQIAMSLHPERAYEPVKEIGGGETPQDTQSLREFYERFDRKIIHAQVFNAEREEKNVESCGEMDDNELPIPTEDAE